MTSEVDQLERFRTNGLIVGFCIGLLLGVLISGPHLHVWRASSSLLVIAGSAIGGAFIGYIALAIFASYLTSGAGTGPTGSEIGPGITGLSDDHGLEHIGHNGHHGHNGHDGHHGYDGHQDSSGSDSGSWGN